MSPEELALIRAIYDEEVRFTDAGIGRLLGALRERGLESRTWTVVTADHGEEFLERGHFGHTRTLHEELVRVPLIVRGPRDSRVRTPTEIDRPVSLVSLMPTILAMAGVETDVAFHGPSLLPILTGAVTPPFAHPLFEVDFVPGLEENTENEAHKRGLVTAGFKLIEDMETGDLSLYDLGSDPGETVDLAKQRPAVRRRLQAALRQATRRRAQPGPAARDAPLNDEQIERLRELGYIADEM